MTCWACAGALQWIPKYVFKHFKFILWAVLVVLCNYTKIELNYYWCLAYILCQHVQLKTLGKSFV